jgi:hypothetical protein
MSRTKRHILKVNTTKEMAEVFKRKSGPQIRPTSRMKERQRWEHEFIDEYYATGRSDESAT